MSWKTERVIDLCAAGWRRSTAEGTVLDEHRGVVANVLDDETIEYKNKYPDFPVFVSYSTYTPSVAEALLVTIEAGRDRYNG